jgi:hypothetical protein
MPVSFVLRQIEDEIRHSNDPYKVGDFLCVFYENLIESQILDKSRIDDIYTYIENRVIERYAYRGIILPHPILSHFRFMTEVRSLNLKKWELYSVVYASYIEWCDSKEILPVDYFQLRDRLIVAGYGFKILDGATYIKYDDLPIIRLNLAEYNLSKSDPLP